MKNKDDLQGFIFENAPVRGKLVHLEQSFQAIMEQHQYPTLIRQILGEMLVVACLLSATIKFKGRLSIQFQGKDKLKLLLAQCTDKMQIRGLAQWKSELTQAELLQQLKEGVLAIMIEPEDMSGQRYQGVVEWQGNSLAEAIEHYFRKSEQIPTRIWLAVDTHQAAGLLIQVLPGETGKMDEFLEVDDEWSRISHLSNTITPEELFSKDNTTLLHQLYVEDVVRVFIPEPIEFRCTCSVERGINALRMLGRPEVEEELQDKQSIVVTCEFCNQKFTFDRADVAKVFQFH